MMSAVRTNRLGYVPNFSAECSSSQKLGVAELAHFCVLMYNNVEHMLFGIVILKYGGACMRMDAYRAVERGSERISPSVLSPPARHQRCIDIWQGCCCLAW